MLGHLMSRKQIALNNVSLVLVEKEAAPYSVWSRLQIRLV
jgi:hypothetical protein